MNGVRTGYERRANLIGKMWVPRTILLEGQANKRKDKRKQN
jgi:hypothetical protein